MLKLFGNFLACAAFLFALSACTDEKPEPPPKKDQVPAPATEKAVQWGPQSTIVGEGFNVQPNGDSSIWFDLGDVSANNKYEVWFGDTRLIDVYWTPGKVGSALVPSSSLRKSGEFPVFIISKPDEKKYVLGIFKITQK